MNTYHALSRDALLDIPESFHRVPKLLRILRQDNEDQLGITPPTLFFQNLRQHKHTIPIVETPRTLETFPCAIRGVDIELGFDTSSRAGKSVGQSVSQSKPNHPLIPWLLIS